MRCSGCVRKDSAGGHEAKKKRKRKKKKRKARENKKKKKKKKFEDRSNACAVRDDHDFANKHCWV